MLLTVVSLIGANRRETGRTMRDRSREQMRHFPAVFRFANAFRGNKIAEFLIFRDSPSDRCFATDFYVNAMVDRKRFISLALD
jgi:hypothetical protein